MVMNKQWFQTNKPFVELALLFVYLTVNAIINATTVLMHDMRSGEDTILQWEPFVWELSSAYSTLLLFPLIALYTKYYGWQWKYPFRTFLRYLLVGVVFCLLHVGLMVVFREVAYSFTSSEYNFATDINSLIFELLYEMRKDIWSFFFYIITIEVYRYVINQWVGDTKPIFESTPLEDVETSTSLPEILLVKKMGKEFLIKTKDIQWAESAGNYLNLYIDNMIYPMRITMSQFAEQAKSYGFIRTHRSQIINARCIKHIEKLQSGDADIQMQDDTKLKLSRRYKKEFENFVMSLSKV